MGVWMMRSIPVQTRSQNVISRAMTWHARAQFVLARSNLSCPPSPIVHLPMSVDMGANNTALAEVDCVVCSAEIGNTEALRGMLVSEEIGFKFGFAS
jgi:hypothetical protein